MKLDCLFKACRLGMCKLADAYNVSIDYLVGRTDNPQISR